MVRETFRVGSREREPIRAKRVAIDIADIVANLSSTRIRVFELQNRFLHLPIRLANFDGASVVDRGVRLGVIAALCCELVDGSARGRVLAADVEVDWEFALVADVRLACFSGCCVDESDWGAARDGGSIGDGGGVDRSDDVCVVGIVR